MTTLDPRARAAVERLLDHGEHIVMWSPWFETIEWNGPLTWRRYVLGRSEASGPRWLVLTPMRLLSVKLMRTRFAAQTRVESYWARPLSSFFAWRSTRHTDTNGVTRTYSLRVTARDGLPTGTLVAYPPAAEPFLAALTAASTRFKTLAGSRDVASQLSAMHTLWSEGALSDDEFQRAKELFLGRPPDAEERAAASLRNPKELLDAGVLTESEFRSKKWQVLSAKP